MNMKVDEQDEMAESELYSQEENQMIDPSSAGPRSYQHGYNNAFCGRQNTKFSAKNDRSLEIAIKPQKHARNETETNGNENEQRIPAMITERETQNLHPVVPGIKRNHNIESKNNFEAFNEVSLNSKAQAGIFEKSPSSTVKDL